MAAIEFYYDPICPFCWITSRWLLQVSAERTINITWRQFSLALKNDELAPRGDESEHALSHRDSHRIHRVIRQATSQQLASSIDLYSTFGTRHHLEKRPYDDELIQEVLAAHHLPVELLQAANDTSIDTRLMRELDAALDAAGTDIGVPVIVFTDKNNKRLGYFGPVLNELPDSLDESLAIWDGLEQLATTSSFYEIKRTRSGYPIVDSTA
ncbi:MAG TPA: DsbA family protein [Candidatus Saccharibacteria bacterium]|nr:DsbA family protein [Candidatus Saccharibacteria bacterium]HMR38304.1 DsbA family protein [Candidatus Saccharibacteria bacterium]